MPLESAQFSPELASTMVSQRAWFHAVQGHEAHCVHDKVNIAIYT